MFGVQGLGFRVQDPQLTFAWFVGIDDNFHTFHSSSEKRLKFLRSRFECISALARLREGMQTNARGFMLRV